MRGGCARKVNGSGATPVTSAVHRIVPLFLLAPAPPLLRGREVQPW
jgi:hypothetical protein